MNDTIYRKVGRKYEPIGKVWSGWPADGVWYVADGRQSLIMRIGDMPDPMPLAALEHYRDLAADAMRETYSKIVGETLQTNQDGSVSFIAPTMNEMVTAFFKAVANEEAKRWLEQKRG